MNQLGKHEWDSENKLFVGTTFSYDRFGNRTSATAATGGTTDYSVDTTYNTYEVTQTAPANTTGKRLVTHYGYDARFGTRSLTVDPNGTPGVTCYDDFGRRATLQGPLPARADRQLAATSCLGSGVVSAVALPAVTLTDLVNYEHAWENQIATVRKTALESWQLSRGAPVTLLTVDYFDGMARNYRRVTQAEDGSLSRVTRDDVFNAMHDITESRLPYFIGDANPHRITQRFDPLDRSVGNSAPWTTGGSVQTVSAQIAYSVTKQGETSTRVEAKGTPFEATVLRTRGYFDNKARATGVRYTDTGRGGKPLNTLMSRDLTGRVTRLSPPGNTGKPGSPLTCSTMPDGKGPNTDLYTYSAYDSIGRLCAERAPALGTVRYVFGTDSLLKQTINNTGVTHHTYDLRGRRLTTAYPGGIVTTLAWDNPKDGDYGLDRLAYATVTGQAQPITRSYAYDAYGNPEQSALRVGSDPALTLTTRFDPANRPERLQLPNGSVITTTLAFGNVTGLNVDGKRKLTATDFTAFGHPQTLSYANGVVTRTTYAANFQVHGIQTADPSGAPVFSEQYSRDPFGYLLAVDGQATPWSAYKRRYAYLSNRLTSASDSRIGTAVSKPTYDSAGNLSSLGPLKASSDGFQIGSTSTYNGAPLQPVYNRVGGLTAVQAPDLRFTASYDGRQRLARVTVPSGTAQYAYDHTGQRAWHKDTSGTEYRYLSPAYTASTGSGSQATLALHGPMGPAWLATASASTLQTERWLHNDERRSVVLESDATGSLSGHYLYGAYGALQTGGSSGTPDYGFTGQRLDADSGLYLYAARYYLPQLGRFTRADTQYGAAPERHDAANRYAFLLNNPQYGFDPSGHAVLSCALPVVGGIGGLTAGGINIYLGAGRKQKNDLQAGVGGGAATAGLMSVIGGIVGCRAANAAAGERRALLRSVNNLRDELERTQRAVDNLEANVDDIRDTVVEQCLN